MILSENELRELLEKVISENPGKTMSIGVYGTEMGSTRFANNAVHQNVHESSLGVSMRAVVGKRIGILDDSVFAVVVFVVAVTTLLAPLALKPLMKDLPEECSV